MTAREALRDLSRAIEDALERGIMNFVTYRSRLYLVRTVEREDYGAEVQPEPYPWHAVTQRPAEFFNRVMLRPATIDRRKMTALVEFVTEEQAEEIRASRWFRFGQRLKAELEE